MSDRTPEASMSDRTFNDAPDAQVESGEPGVPIVEKGYVRWPRHLDDTDEGGMVVYALFPYPGHENKHFQCCYETPQTALNDSGSIVTPSTISGTKSDIEWKFLNSLHYAMICLGNTNASWWDPKKSTHGAYWHATLDDVTPEGRAILDPLAKLYGVEPFILTYLDT